MWEKTEEDEREKEGYKEGSRQRVKLEAVEEVGDQMWGRREEGIFGKGREDTGEGEKGGERRR